jgi:hypothetical protein
MGMSDLQAQRVIGLGEAGVVALSDAINHLVGTATTVLARPGDKTFLVLIAETGNFRARLGSHTEPEMPATADIAMAVGDGTGALRLAAGNRTVLPAPKVITVKGYSASDVLTYYWV